MIRCFNYMDDSGIAVDTMITDRHLSISKWLRETRKTTKTKHYYDLWHIIKGLTKKLTKLSKQTGFEVVGPWIKSIRSHLYWCVDTTTQGFGDMVIAKWKSVIRHIANIHTDHPSALFPACLHDQLEDRLWISEGK